MFYMAIRNLKAEISDHCLIGIVAIPAIKIPTK